ncbi:MAG: hypothetical protein M3Z00_10980 [Actinomycetota bacterium]|nr:hypothetical protein [Actinomycetota bacterium]
MESVDGWTGINEPLEATTVAYGAVWLGSGIDGTVGNGTSGWVLDG